MKRAMISQPMAGKTEDEIIETRRKAIEYLESRGYEVINTYFSEEWYRDQMLESNIVNRSLCFLAKSLDRMSLCHAVYFCSGWDMSRGCKIEHEVATVYGLEIIYEA